MEERSEHRRETKEEHIPGRCSHCRRSSGRQGIPRSTCHGVGLRETGQGCSDTRTYLLDITEPRASKTALEVKFSLAISTRESRWRLFSCSMMLNLNRSTR